MTKPSPDTVKAWTRLVRAHAKALSLIENALKEASLPPLAWYDVLLELERAGKNGLRPFELEQKLLLPQYGISRLIDRIEKESYLEKHVCTEDGRGQTLFITSEGKNLRKQIWKVYGKAMEEALGKKLTEQETRMLSELLEQLI